MNLEVFRIVALILNVGLVCALGWVLGRELKTRKKKGGEPK